MDSCSSDFEDNFEGAPWKEERREPLGAAKDAFSDGEPDERAESCETYRLHALEEEQEALSSSLFSLASHLAQVQFRLRQIVDAPPPDKEAMLRSLEEFTFRGIPDLGSIVPKDATELSPACSTCRRLDDKLRERRARQSNFIERTKRQLNELDSFVAGGFSKITADELERHGSTIDDLKRNVERTLHDGRQRPLTAEELRHRANCATGSNRGFCDVVSQLQAQVEDMQRFIDFLNGTPAASTQNGSEATVDTSTGAKPVDGRDQKSERPSRNDELKAETVTLMKKIVALLHVFALAQFGCSASAFSKNELKRTNLMNHWGDLRARLEMSIDAVLNILRNGNSRTGSAIEDYESDSEDNTVVLQNVPLTIAVRKHLAINIRELMEHGLTPSNENNTVVPFVGCFPVRRSVHSRMHAWELILRYYEMSNGERYNSTPARKLSQSFNLDIVGNTTISNKESMLSAIGAIIASHKPYKRSYDSHFKAFVCAGLNANKLVAWLNIIFKNKMIMKLYYSSTSYAANTGFQDSLQSLDRLTTYKFDLPIDLAVRQFQNIKDVFM